MGVGGLHDGGHALSRGLAWVNGDGLGLRGLVGEPLPVLFVGRLRGSRELDGRAVVGPARRVTNR